MDKGFMICLEACEGGGKTSASGVIQKMLEQRGLAYIRTREPGGTPEGEKLRGMLLTEEGAVWDPISEILLMTTSRIQHVNRVILPAIERGEVVLCDRFVHSTLAYQGAGHNGPMDFIRNLHRDAVGGMMPDMTIVLDVHPEVGLARAKARLSAEGSNEDRMENFDISFHHRVRQAYLDIASADPERHMIIDANQPIEDVHNEITRRLSPWIDQHTR